MLNLLIKPASGLCNMRCKYCFYRDELVHRDVPDRGIMQKNTVDALIEKVFEQEKQAVLFAFQGGEPMLAGFDFFKSFVKKVRESNKNRIKVSYTIQTNGLLLNAQWAKFLRENKFLVGLSYDSLIHDRFRLDTFGRGTHTEVVRAAKILEKHGAEFNILTVVTADVARNIEKIYEDMKRRRFRYLQFIPCLNPLDNEQNFEYTLGNDDYLYFLKTLFSLWYEDFMSGNYISIRYFDNLYSLFIGQMAEQCGMSGQCNIQYVVEGNGDVYPCDFYCLDEYCLGNICEKSFAELCSGMSAKRFIQESTGFSSRCKTCKCFALCRSGCRRYQRDGEYIYCNAFLEFYNDLQEKLPKIRERLKIYMNT